MESLNIGELAIDVVPPQEPSAPLRLDWRGRSVERQPHIRLEPFFVDVLTEAADRKAPVEMHFEMIAGFNSSTIGFLIQLIQNAKQRGVKLVIVYDASQVWQRVSFDVFAAFAKDTQLFELRPMGKP